MSLFFGYDETEANSETDGAGGGGAYNNTKLKTWVLTQITGSKTYTDSEFAKTLPLVGGQMKVDIDLLGGEIKNLGPPRDSKSAVTRGWVETKLSIQPGGGLSDTGFTVKGAIHMAQNQLDSPLTDDFGCIPRIRRLLFPYEQRVLDGRNY